MSWRPSWRRARPSKTHNRRLGFTGKLSHRLSQLKVARFTAQLLKRWSNRDVPDTRIRQSLAATVCISSGGALTFRRTPWADDEAPWTEMSGWEAWIDALCAEHQTPDERQESIKEAAIIGLDGSVWAKSAPLPEVSRFTARKRASRGL